MSDEPTLAPYEPRHREGLLRLWRRYFGAWSADRLERRWAWQFDENPWRTERKPVVLLGTSGDEVVGHISALPLPLRVDGTVRTTLCASGLVVDEEHRWLGFRLVRSLTGDPPIMATAMAEGAQKLFVQCGAVLVPLSRERFVFPRRYGGALAGSIRRRAPRAIGGLVSARAMNILAPWYTPPRRPTRKPLPRSGAPDIRPIARFDAAYDDLWRLASVPLAFTIEKTSDYMNWRYVDCPTLNSVRLALHAPDGRLLGIAATIVRTETDSAGRPCESFGEIVELIGDTADPSVLEPLLIAAMHALDRRRVDAITATGLSPALHPMMERLGFIRRSDDAFALAVKPGPALAASALLLADRTYYTAGDGDSLYTLGI